MKQNLLKSCVAVTLLLSATYTVEALANNTSIRQTSLRCRITALTTP